MRVQRKTMSIQGKTMCVQEKQSNIVKNHEIQQKIIIFEKGKIFEYSMLMLRLWAKNRNFSAQIKT